MSNVKQGQATIPSTIAGKLDQKDERTPGDQVGVPVAQGACASRGVRAELQRFILPSERELAVLPNYARWKTGRIRLAAESGGFPLERGTCIDFATPANALNCRKWRWVEGFKDVALRLSGEGTLRIIVSAYGENQLYHVLLERQLTLSIGVTCEIEIEDALALKAQNIGLEIEAESDSLLQHVAWVSNDPAVAELMRRSSNTRVLQNFIFPDEARADRIYLYCRWPDQVPALSRSGQLRLMANETIDFTTFFNAFSHRKWHELTGLSDLSLCLSGKGKVRVVVNMVFETGRTSALLHKTIDLSQGSVTLELGDPGQIPGELTAMAVTALDRDAALTFAAWTTRQIARRDVRLAAVITTFKRETAASEAAHRFASETIPGAPAGSLKLYIIDNGNSIPNLNLPNVTIIPNRNLGGAGGFTRGLLEVIKSGEFTHALFMDDDASCEPESVLRAMALLAYAIDPKHSVSGAMMHADDPYIQYEKGASLNMEGRPRSIWKIQNGSRDLRHIRNVASNDRADKVNYGAWWFFAFPLMAVEHLPFPFFVRGDDVDFSLVNRLPVATLNGVASWCDNFGYKLNPSTEYLAWRSWLALSFMYQSASGQRYAIRLARSEAIRLGRRFDYAGMHGVLDAMNHVVQGPRVFGDDPAPLTKLGAVKRRDTPFLLEPAALVHAVPLERRPMKLRWRLASRLSLGGHLLPSVLKRDAVMHTTIAWETGRHSLVRASRVVFGRGREYRVLEANSRLFLVLITSVMFSCLRLLFLRKTIARRYQDEANLYRSKEYWEHQFFG